MTFRRLMKCFIPLLMACGPVAADMSGTQSGRTIRFAALIQGITSIALDDDQIISFFSPKKNPAIRFRRNNITGGLNISFHPDMPVPDMISGYLTTSRGQMLRYEIYPEQSNRRIRHILFSSGLGQAPTSEGEKE